MEPQKYWDHEQALRRRYGPETLSPVLRAKLGAPGQKILSAVWDIMPETLPYPPLPRFVVKLIYGRR